MAKRIYTEEEARAREKKRKHEYNEKTYTRLIFDVRNEIAEKYKAKCKEMNIPYSKPLHEAVLEFLEK